jgi:hypothetical protein
MALKSFNVAKGLSVGAVATDVIDSNANITAAGLTANGAVSLTGGNISLGNVANLHITGGSNGQVLTTDGAGNLTFSTSAASYGDSNVETLLNSSNVANIRANYFYGDGSNLANIAGANVSGEVANAGYATNAGTAYSVSGANVSGEVANAAFSTNANNASYLTGQLGNTLLTNGYAIAGGAFDYSSIEVGLPGGAQGVNLKALASNLTIQTGTTGTSTSTWTFDQSGGLTLPDGGTITEGTITGAINANTISLKPSSGTNANQQLLIYPTAGADNNHLHLTTGNLYDTELYLGNDDLYVKLANTGTIVLNANDDDGNVAQWTFAANGNLTLPANTFAVNYANGTAVTIGNAEYAANAGYANFAGEAYSVSGSNVSGEVANAGFANAVTTTLDNSSAGDMDVMTYDGNIKYTSSVTIDVSNGTLKANLFSGNGSSLSALAGANVSGEVANAGYATNAGTAYSVSGANVSGEVANAGYSTNAGTAYSVSGANVSGEVANAGYSTNAGTAYSVSGANVSGEVANAGYSTKAGTAYSVSGANVSGEVANANYALYAGTAYAVDGSNVSGTVANANFAANASFANSADYVIQNAQANITSVGTLTSLAVSGNANIGNGLIVASGGANITGNVSISGNMTVNGNITYQGVVDLVVSDPLIFLASENTADNLDIGFVGQYNTGSNIYTGLARNHTTDTWNLFDGLATLPTTTIDWANTTAANLKLGTLTASSANVSGNVDANNVNVTNAVVAASLQSNTTATIANTVVGGATLTTTSTAANQVIAKVSAGNGKVVEFLVKGVDGIAKYGTATVVSQVGTAASGECDYTSYAVLNVGGSPGDLSVALVDSNVNVALLVQPTSSNSTVWVTQYRVL